MALYAASMAASWALFWVGAAFLTNLTTRPVDGAQNVLFSTMFFGILAMAVVASIVSAALFALMLRRVGEIRVPAILAGLAILTVIVFPQLEGALYRPPQPEAEFNWQENRDKAIDAARRAQQQEMQTNNPNTNERTGRQWARIQPGQRAIPDGTYASTVQGRFPGGTWVQEPYWGLIYPFQYNGQVRAVMVNESNQVVGEIELVSD